MAKMSNKAVEEKIEKIKKDIAMIMPKVQKYNLEYLKNAWKNLDYVQHMQQNHRLIKNQARSKK